MPLAGEELMHHSGVSASDGVTFGQPWVLPVHQLNTWNLHLDALREKLMNLVSASPGKRPKLKAWQRVKSCRTSK